MSSENSVQMPARTLAIGDIHGCDIALETLLNCVQPTTDDTVIILGDIVDRGPDTRRCIDLLLDMEDTCQLVFLMGNHEEMMLDAYHQGAWGDAWTRYGGVETLESYQCGIEGLPSSHIDFIQSGRDYFQTAQAIFVHANLEPHIHLDRQSAQSLRWTHLTGNEQPHVTGKRIVCGHTSQKSGVPAVMDGWVCIDTFAHGGEFLTCLDINRDIIVRTKQTGELEAEIPLDEIALVFQPRGN
jgi:serine/threonine protein phosphatase 1